MKKYDNWIKRRVQALERNIPQEVEEQVSAGLSRTRQIPRVKPMPSPYYFARRLTLIVITVGCVFLVVFVSTIRREKIIERDQQVLVQTAKVEGVEAQTYIFSTKDLGMKIIWFEKIREE